VAACPVANFAHQYAVPGIAGLSADGTGNLYIAATLFNSADFGSGSVSSAGSADLVVARLDPASGNATWTKPFGDDQDQFATGVAVSRSGQVVAMGTFFGSVTAGNNISNASSNAIDFIVGLNSADGTGLWAKSVDTKLGGLIAIAGSGNPEKDEVVVCGYTMPCAASADPNDAGCTGPMTDLSLTGHVNSDKLEDIIIAKLHSATGAVVWARQYGGAGSQLCKAVTMDSSGNVFAAGVYNGDFGAGSLDTFGPTVQAIWVAKLDSATGDIVTAKDFGGNGLQSVAGIAVDGGGNVAVTGNMQLSLAFGGTTLTSSGGTDGFLAKLDPNLAPLWAKNWGDAKNQESHAVGFKSNGDIVVVGAMKGHAVFGSTTLVAAGTAANDAYWAKYNADDSSGDCPAMIYGDIANQSADFLVISSGGALNVAGFSKGTIDFGNGKSLTSVNPSGFVVQIGP